MTTQVYKRRPKLISHEQALTAAKGLLEADGAAGLSMRKLASNLNVSLPTVYATIGSREGLVEDLLTDLTAELIVYVRATQNADVLSAALRWVGQRSWYLSLVRELEMQARRTVWARVGAVVDAEVVDIRNLLVVSTDRADRVAVLPSAAVVDLVVTVVDIGEQIIRSGWCTAENASNLMLDLASSVVAPLHERESALA